MNQSIREPLSVGFDHIAIPKFSNYNFRNTALKINGYRISADPNVPLLTFQTNRLDLRGLGLRVTTVPCPNDPHRSNVTHVFFFSTWSHVRNIDGNKQSVKASFKTALVLTQLFYYYQGSGDRPFTSARQHNKNTKRSQDIIQECEGL